MFAAGRSGCREVKTGNASVTTRKRRSQRCYLAAVGTFAALEPK
jgi:hypothetical protein